MEELTLTQLEDEAVAWYFDGISHKRTHGESQKRADWVECKIVLEELKRRDGHLNEYFNAIYQHVS